MSPAIVPVINGNPYEVIDSVHNDVHTGHYFRLVHFYTGVTNLEVKRYLFSTGPRNCHFYENVMMEGPCYVQFSRNPTIATSGTQLATVNLNDEYQYGAYTRCYHATTVTGTGTVLFNSYTLGTTGGTGSMKDVIPSTVSTRPGTEFIMKKNTNYMIQITNTASTTINMSAVFEFYEEE